MKVFIFASLLLVTVTQADRLENTYLPPASAHSAGGSGNFLATPRQSSFGGHGSSFSSGQSFGQQNFGQGNYRSSSNNVPILRYNNDNDGFGSYRYEYETGNGIQAQEAGQQNNVHGSYSFTAPDGQTYTVTYTADENGFQAQGAHLPTPPPIPEAILKSLQYNAQHPQENGDDGSYHHQGGDYNGQGVIATSRQYVAPRRPSFNARTGYNY